MSEFSPRAMLIRSLTNYNNGRARTQQTEIGPSSLGDCRRKVYHQIKGTPETNPDTEILAALLGTFIHEGIEKALENEDPFGNNFFKEIATSYEGMPGNVDLYIKDMAIVVDWKTTKKKNLKTFPSTQNIWQVHTYARMLLSEGKKVDKVAIVVIPRDGRMEDIAEYVADYDPQEADNGLLWLEDIEQMVANKEKPPKPERDVRTWCTLYCQFYDPTAKIGCPGK